MAEKKFSARRCRDTRKPHASECIDVVFYQCSICNSVFAITGNATTKDLDFVCCEEKVIKLTPIDIELINNELELDYSITGGYNDNAVEVSWKRFTEIEPPEWIYLKTFTGGYLKYVNKLKTPKKPPVIFALADTDAFSYCDESPCLECVFRCKRGFMIYVFVKDIGLVAISLDKMNAHWQSEAKSN